MSDLTPSKDLMGRLIRSSSGWILLSLPNQIQRGYFAALNARGAELPRHKGRVNTHISVMRPEELERIGNPPIKELGRFFSFQTGPVVETNPMGWDEMERVWFMKILSPDLVQLRRSYVLSDKPKRNGKELDFHMTIAVRRKHVLRQNTIAKEASFEGTEEEWEAVSKVATLLADEYQNQLSQQAFNRLSDPMGSPTMERLGALAQFWDGQHVGIPNAPSALASMLMMGMTGAGLGYLGGRVGSKVVNLFGKNLDEKKVGRMGATLGGVTGAIPGLMLALGNYYAGKPILTSSFLNDRDPYVRRPFAKHASFTGAAFDPDHFRQLVNENPFNRMRMDPRERAMATGLVDGAQHLPGRNQHSSLVTPVDIARMAVGMGSGYASGSLVGNVLGGLMGLPDARRDDLIRAGTFAGAIKSIIPLAFGQ